MCGIVGGYGAMEPETAARMMECIAHRGPDDDGLVQVAGNTLGHRRSLWQSFDSCLKLGGDAHRVGQEGEEGGGVRAALQGLPMPAKTPKHVSRPQASLVC